MDARELTRVANDLCSRLQEAERKIEYLEQELAKQRLIVDDMSVDVKMLNRKE